MAEVDSGLSLQQLVAAFEQRGVGALGELRQHPVLVYCGGEVPADALGFETRAAEAPWDHRVAVALVRSGTPVRPEVLARAGPVYPVKKRPGGPFPDRIGVGRVRTADISLRMGSVSKYHAYFTRDEGSGRWTVWDARSRNGTRVGLKRVPPGEGLALDDVCQLMFGDETFLWFTEDQLQKLLVSLVVKNEPRTP